MRVQKRKVTNSNNYPMIACFDENRPSYLGRSHSISLKKCKTCPKFVKRVKGYVYCKKISAPYWLKDRVVEI